MGDVDAKANENNDKKEKVKDDENVSHNVKE